VGALTVEQAYINWSSVFHATFVKYLQDLLTDGFVLPGEQAAVEAFRSSWLRPLTAEGLVFREGPLADPAAILDELATVGTLHRGAGPGRFLFWQHLLPVRKYHLYLPDSGES